MSGNVQKDSGSILCDMCTEEDRKPARKTCMKCEISMCVHHLQAHLTTPVLLQTHPLTEPMAIDGNTKCPQHGKLLEYYCLDDMTCVCVSCAIEDQHRLHNMKTFSTAHRELTERLKAEQQVLQEKTDDENVSLEKWEQSEREKVGRCGVRLIEAATNLRDVSLTSVQSSVSARMVAIRTSKSSIEAALKEKDIFRFLQTYSQVNQDVAKAKAVDLRKGLESGSQRDELVQEIRQEGEKITKHTSDFIGSLLTLVDPEHHQELMATSSDLIFKPQIVHRGISLSKDSRKVYYNSAMGLLPPSMLCVESTLSDPNFGRWVIRLSTNCNWTVGLCDKHYATSMEDGNVCGLRCRDEQLLSLMTEEGKDDVPPLAFKEELIPGKKLMASQKRISSLGEAKAQEPTRSQTVEVTWSVANTLSFFSRIGPYQRKEILSVKMRSAVDDRVFFVCLEQELKKTSIDNSDCSSYNQFNKSQFGAPMSFGNFKASSNIKQSFIFGTTAAMQQDQKQWNCSCGKVYTETSDRYQCGGYSYEKSLNPSCSCGRVIGPCSVTEVLCELV